jgi:transcription initiation factor TFIIIB Brf1 subunit/transcription initiation factor TFIIB
MMGYDRNTVTIRGKRILHSTAQRDWVCGVCGSGLATRWFADAPHWRTVCTNEPGHDPDAFIHRHMIPYIQHEQMADELTASDVLAHLPPELQAEIERRD